MRCRRWRIGGLPRTGLTGPTKRGVRALVRCVPPTSRQRCAVEAAATMREWQRLRRSTRRLWSRPGSEVGDGSLVWHHAHVRRLVDRRRLRHRQERVRRRGRQDRFGLQGTEQRQRVQRRDDRRRRVRRSVSDLHQRSGAACFQLDVDDHTDARARRGLAGGQLDDRLRRDDRALFDGCGRRHCDQGCGRLRARRGTPACHLGWVDREAIESRMSSRRLSRSAALRDRNETGRIDGGRRRGAVYVSWNWAKIPLPASFSARSAPGHRALLPAGRLPVSAR